MRAIPKRKVLLHFTLIAWLLMVVLGLFFVAGYQNTAGRSETASTTWPAESRIQRTPGTPTLVMMVHPHCPCSRASIGELAILMAKVQGVVNANVLFVKPRDSPLAWETTDLWTSAAIIPGVKVSVDDDGNEARRFRSHTSGQIFLYGANGLLLFSGGITAGRGHFGDNEGLSALVSLLIQGDTQTKETAVFGCPLFAEDRTEKEEELCHAPHGK
jgi:hypothetical protein